jgi:hypothetical protein
VQSNVNKRNTRINPAILLSTPFIIVPKSNPHSMQKELEVPLVAVVTLADTFSN